MRKKRSILNIIGSLGSYGFSVIFNFITQMFIIRILGVEYSGINGLFTNVLTMLSIAELGIGVTIIYKLYEPLANNDKESIKSWLNFYKICYRVIAVLVLFIGLILTPFIPTIVGKTYIRESVRVLYFISLLDTVLSYCLTYKRSLIYADQKNYIISLVHIGYTVFMNITQISLLILFKNFILFLLVKLIYRLLENIILNIYANKHYPYIKEKCKEIPESEKKDVFERVKSMLFQKISYVFNKGIDSVIITSMLGIATAGYYANYNLIVTSITAIIFQIVSSMTASVGNLLTEKDKEKSYKIYKKINMLDSILTCIGICGFLAVIQDFITIWIGEKYILNNLIVISFALYIYSDSIRRTMTLFKDSAGICKEDKYNYLVMALINLISSIILCKLFGMSGVIFGTTISYIYLITYSYPKYIFKPLFKKTKRLYYLENIKYFLLIIVSSAFSFFIGTYISFNNSLINIIIKGIISVIMSLVLFMILYRKTDEFKYYIEQISIIRKKILKKKKIIT